MLHLLNHVLVHFLAALAVLSLAVHCEDDVERLCPQELVEQEDTDLVVNDGICYRFVEDETFYHSAGEACKKQSGLLAMPKTKEINAFLVDAIRERGWKHTWIGLDHESWTGIYWADGSRLWFFRYHNYADGNGRGRRIIGRDEMDDRDCAGLNAEDGKWYDFACGTSFFFFGTALTNYVCQYA